MCSQCPLCRRPAGIPVTVASPKSGGHHGMYDVGSMEIGGFYCDSAKGVFEKKKSLNHFDNSLQVFL